MGAANLPIGSVAIMLLSLVVLSRQRTLGITGLVISAVSLVAAVLWSAAQSAGSALDLGLGSGGMERPASYPSDIRLVIVGILAIILARDQTATATRQVIRLDGLGTM